MAFFCTDENEHAGSVREEKKKAHIEHGSNTHTYSRRRFGFGRFLLAKLGAWWDESKSRCRIEASFPAR